MTAKSLLLCVSVVAISLVCASGASAQSAFDRSRNVSVRDRPHPEYDALGIRAGAFMISPRIDIGLSHDDNIYAAETAKIGDTIIDFHPQVTAKSTWSRHSLSFGADSTTTKYKNVSAENSTQWNLNAAGQFDIRRDANVGATASFTHAIEPRGSASYTLATKEPIKYDQFNAALKGMKEFNRVRITGGASIESYDYKDGVAVTDNSVVDEDYRDRDAYTFKIRGDYALSPATALFADLSNTQTNYKHNTTTDRDSTDNRLLLGVNFEVTQLVTGELSAGYDRREYDQVGAADVKNFSYRGNLSWYPTQLITVNLTANKVINDSGLIDSIGYVSDDFTLQADYELLRSTIVTAKLESSKDDYQDIDRTDKRYGGSLSATYLVNRVAGVTLAYTLLKQDSSGTDRGVNFADNRFSVSLTLRR